MEAIAPQKSEQLVSDVSKPAKEVATSSWINYIATSDPLCWLWNSVLPKSTGHVSITKQTVEFDNFYVTYNGKKYNIASFVGKHPGGRKVLLPLRDGDMTKEFDAVGHSKAATVLLERYLVKSSDNSAASSSEVATATDKATAEEIAKTEKYLARNSFVLPSGDIHFLSKKLFTPEDQYFVHKSFGFLSLFSFVYRYLYLWPTTGSLGLTGTAFDYATLVLHMLLTGSSLIFHVLERRLTHNPLIIYEEYRLHAIVFTLRTFGVSVIGFIPNTVLAAGPVNFLLIAWMLFCHILVDKITQKHGTPGVTAVRNEKADEFRSMKLFFSYYQFLVIGASLVLCDQTSDIGYNALIAIQSSAFLMTLKRKSIISWTTYAFFYGACLVLSMSYMLQKKGFLFFCVIGFCFLLRVKLSLDKYTIWALYAAVMTGLQANGITI